MEYIKNRDYDFIMNKYHDQGKPFNSHRRWIRHDAIFDDATGLDGDTIIAGILEQDAQNENLPHPVRKAHAFAYVLKNTRISCDVRDIFPAINMVDRPLNRTVIATWKNEVFGSIIPEVEEKRLYMLHNGIATIRPDYDHSVPVWDRLFKLGFAGIMEESQLARSQKTDLTPEQDAFFEGIRITYTAILDFIRRLETQAETDGNLRMAKALHNIGSQPPKSFYEALLTDYLYFMLCEHIEGMQVRSLANFDRHFYPFYQQDLKNGVAEEQIRQDLAYFFLQFTAIGNYWNQPVYLGGCKEDESTQINALSYLFLDVYDKMGIYNPKIQIKVADSTPKDLILKALDMIRRGNNSIVFVSDATIRKSLENNGATGSQARLCDVRGCYEFAVPGAISTEMNYVNLLKPMEYALHRGCDGVTGNFAGLESPAAEDYKTFEDFFAEYKRQLAFLLEQVIENVNAFEDYLAYVNPQSMLSATCPSCLDKGVDTLAGGATMNITNMMVGFIANAADSLANIKKYVFDKKLLTLPQLRDILDKNFAGNEKLQRILLADRDKFGNNKDLPDGIAKELVEFISGKVCGRPNAKVRGGTWNVGFHAARQSYDQAPHTAASADSRWKGEELSKNMSASMGRNREGATAAILSNTKIDAAAFVSNAPLDLGLLPSAVKGEEGLEAMYALLMTFIKRFAVHDGPGIRTTVFFKGCPLKCLWCHNPESIGFQPQVAFYENKCIGCGECQRADFTPAECLGDARVLYGKETTVEELLPILLEDKDFYETSGGGVTLSGGECLCQADFCAELLKALKKEGIHTAVDTCGFVSQESFDKVLPYTDIFLYDIKAVDEDVHIQCTGQSNKRILENIRYIDSLGKPIEVRIPYVPEYNADQMERIAAFLSALKNVSAVKVLPYHNLAGSKYAALGMENTLPKTLPTEKDIQKAQALFV